MNKSSHYYIHLSKLHYLANNQSKYLLEEYVSSIMK